MRAYSKSSRAYESPLRKEQAESTRKRILDAVGREVKAGSHELSYTSVARRAKVAVPTVYRHFPTPEELWMAFTEHVASKVGCPEAPPPGAGFEEQVRFFFRRQSAVAKKFGAHRYSALVWQMRRETTVAARRKLIDAWLDTWTVGLDAQRRKALGDLLVVLCSSAVASAFWEYLGLEGDEAAEQVVWLIGSMKAQVKRELRRTKP